jgi:hypothetical protein
MMILHFEFPFTLAIFIYRTGLNIALLRIRFRPQLIFETDLFMGKLLLSLLVILLALPGPLCHSQEPVKVSDPRLEMSGNSIIISYDILNSSPEEKYTVSIEIKDESGKVIRARSLKGDIGEGIPGGSGKKIAWDLAADNIYLDAFVFVQIHAWIIPPASPPVVVEEEQAEEQAGEEQARTTSRDEPPPSTRTQEFNRAGIILQSVALPGLGLSRVTGKPHWIRGAAGYGCIAASVVMGRSAVNTYNGIEDLEDFTEINRAYDKALQQDLVADVLLFTAAGIWITDFVWTLVGTSGLKKPAYYGQAAGWSVGGKLDPLSASPLLSVCYRF